MIGRAAAEGAFKVFGRNRAFERPTKHFALAGLSSQREKAVRRRKSIGGPVDNFKAAQVAAPAKTEGSGSDAAQRKRNAAQMRARVGFQNRPLALI